MAGRDVVFRLSVEDDPKNKGIMGNFANQIASLRKQLDDALSGRGRSGGGGSGGGGGGNRGGNNGPNDDLKDRIKLAGQLLDKQIREEAKRLAVEKQAKDRADTEDRAREARFVKWRSDLRIKSFQLEARERERLQKEGEREARHQQVVAQRQSRVHLLAERRRDAALNRVFRGGVGAIGSIGGFIGGDTGSALGNVALGGHVAKEAYEGAKGVAGGIGALVSPGLRAGSSAAVSAGAPVAATGAAALIAWLPALAMAVRGATIAIKGSESSAKVLRFNGGRLLDAKSGGTLGSALGEGIAGSSLNWQRLVSRNLSNEDLNQQANQTGTDRFSDNARVQSNLEISNRNLARQKQQVGLDVARRARIDDLSGRLGVSTYDPRAYAARDLSPAGIGSETELGRGSVGPSTFFSARESREQARQFGAIRRQSALTRMELNIRSKQTGMGRPAVESQLRSDMGIYNSQSGTQESRDAAEARILESKKKLIELGREEHRIATETAQERVSSAKAEYDIRKQMAEEAEENYKSDAERFVSASPEERARIRTISKKKDAGQDLTRSELETGRGYNFTREYTRGQSVKMAEKMGFGGELAQGAKAEKNRLRREAETAKTEVDKAQIQLDNRFKIDVTLKTDEAFAAATLKEFAPTFEKMEEAVNGKLNKLREELINLLNKKAPADKKLPIPSDISRAYGSG